MKRNIKLSAILFIIIALAFNSCTQDEGIGGNSHVSGTLVEKFYNNDFTVFQFEEPAKDQDVFILFGDDNTVGENTSTSFTGDFAFNYLWAGNYKLYYFSDDTTGATNENIELITEIQLEKSEKADLGTLYTYKTLDWNEGSASISGKVMLINYRDESEYPNLEIKDITEAQEKEVYLNYNQSEFYTERIRTQADGTFVFPNLLKGTYTIFVYSQDLTGSTQNVVISQTIEITETTQKVVLENFVTEKI